MDIHNLKTVACYNSRLLLRSWMFRLFLLLLFLIVILYQVLAQTNIFYGVNSGLVTLSSYLPHENAYLFTILQIVPLIFLAGSFLTRFKCDRSSDVCSSDLGDDVGIHEDFYDDGGDFSCYRDVAAYFCE